MDSVPGTLRQWALIADAIAAKNCNMAQREKLIETLIDIVEDYTHLNRPGWHETLLNLLHQTHNRRLAYTHAEVRAILILFQEICHHVASNYDKWWLNWVQEPITEDKPKADEDPFKRFFDDWQKGDEDEDTKS